MAIFEYIWGLRDLYLVVTPVSIRVRTVTMDRVSEM